MTDALLLAYTPFIDPIDLHGVWFLLLFPLAVLIAMAYKAVRTPDMDSYWNQTIKFAAQIIGGIVGLYIFSLFVLNVLLPIVL